MGVVMTRYGIVQEIRLRGHGVVLVALILILLPWGCGDEHHGGPSVRSSETGSAALTIHWHDAPELADPPPLVATALDCAASGVQVVAVQVWDDDTGEWLVSSPEWACSAGGGTVTGIPVGDNRRFVVLAEDSHGNVSYQGEIGGITIKANEITQNVSVDTYPFVPTLTAPEDEAEVELNDFSLEWEAVENAEQYQVLVATDDTFADDQIIIDTTTTETSYAPTGLAPSTRYYWRIHALDAQLNPSAASQQRWFTTSAYANEMPSATITAPEANAVFTQGETITFTGSALDPEEGPLTGSALVWISNMDGSIGSGTTFTRDDLSLGTHTITLTATDSQGASGSDTVLISILSPDSDCHPPLLDLIGNQEVDEGDQLTFTVSASDSDEGDQLTFSAEDLPPGADFDPDAGQFNWLTTFGDQGNYTVTFRVCDNCPDGALCDTEQVIISVGDVCRPPELDAIGDRNVVEGQELSFTVSASDPDEGDQLTFRADRSNLPDEADVAFDPDTGEFSWNTASGEAGDYLVTFEVCDDCPDGPLCDDEQITITVGACSYTIDPPKADFTNAGGKGTISISASDPACEWSATENVDWIKITSGGTGKGNGTVRYTVSANDGAMRDAAIVAAGLDHGVHQAAETTPPSPDPMTWANQPNATSISAIRMVANTASDPNGPVTYQFQFVNSPTGGTGGTTSDWQSGPAYTDADLKANHRYGYRVRARDAALNQTGWSATVYSYTLANTPGAGNFSNVTQTAIQVGWSANGNAQGTEYYCEIPGTNFRSGWISTTSWKSTGLSCGQAYSFQVKARNGDGMETAWRTLGSVKTVDCPDDDAPTPDPMTWDTEPHATSTTAVAMKATSASDPSGPVTYQFQFVDSPTKGTGGTTSKWQSDTTYTDSGLQPNHKYSYHVRAQDANGNQTGWSTTAASYTLANPPGAGNFSSVTQDTIQVSWSANGNSKVTEYYCEIPNTEFNSGWITATSWTSTGLTCGKSYSFRVKARNSNGQETAWRNLGNVSTLDCPDENAPTPNPMTWDTEPHATSTTALAMTATSASDPNGPVTYQFEFVDSPTGGTGGTTSKWQTATAYTDSGLQPNHKYSYHVRAQDANGNQNGWSTTAASYTLANPPGAGNFSNVTETSIQANWSANGNSDVTEYYCEISGTDFNSGWITATSWNSTGLTCGKSYSFRVKARSGNGEETAWHNLGSQQTADCPDDDAPTPDPMTWATEPHATSATALAMTATTATDPSGPVSYHFQFVDSPTGGTGGTSSNWQPGTTYSDSGLQPNHKYSYRVSARDANNNQTAWSTTVASYTLANTPGAGNFSNVTQTAIQVGWNANENSKVTEYYCEIPGTDFHSGWITATSWNSTGLSCGKSYSFQVKARNGDGVETDWRNLGSQQTADCPDDDAPTPDPMTWATEPHATSTSALAMTATTATDPNGPVTYQFEFVDSPTGGTGGTTSNWQPGTTYSDSGLQPNHKYSYRVSARDTNNNQTGWSDTAASYTLAATPEKDKYTNITRNSVQANWRPNGNSKGTEYYCEITKSKFNSGWTTNTFWQFPKLSCGNSYNFRVKARNGNRVETDWTDLGDVSTLDCPEVCREGYSSQPTYSEDCRNRSKGSVCVTYSDGYVWLVYDSISGWDTYGDVQIAHGYEADYYHILDTECIKREVGPY
jgi:chitodextrinase